MNATNKKQPIAIIVLDYPIQVGSETITEIKINRRPKAGDLMDMKSGEQTLGDIMKIVSKISGETMETVKELDLEDLQKVSEVVQNFLGNSPKIGGES